LHRVVRTRGLAAHDEGDHQKDGERRTGQRCPPFPVLCHWGALCIYFIRVVERDALLVGGVSDTERLFPARRRSEMPEERPTELITLVLHAGNAALASRLPAALPVVRPALRPLRGR